ncbi:MAG: hypothetical protein JWM16_4339, partial [Verrucomicrobiales bacterium]|nr:hypothetical protein [Verrucomicrobiales bacterium]
MGTPGTTFSLDAKSKPRGGVFVKKSV